MMRFISVCLCILTALSAPVRAEVDIKEIISPGGIKAWLVEEPTIPFISFNIGFQGGTSLDPADKQGVTHFMMGLLEEGTATKSAAEFTKATESLAAQFGFKARRDSTQITASVLKSNRDQALELLREAIHEPAFSPEAFERVHGQIESMVENAESDPEEIASRSFNDVAYPDHPYAYVTEGTVETVANLTREDVIKAHRDVLTKERMHVGVVGDITAAELGPILDRLLGALPDTGAPLPQKTTFQAPGGISVIDHESAQSVIVFGQPGVYREDPDFFATYLANHIIGGSGFSSRLTQEIREKRGLTYGIYSYLAAYDHAALLSANVSTANESAGQVIDLIKQEWEKIAQTGVTEAELTSAKRFITGSYPLRFDGNAKIARILAGMQMDDLPITYINNRNDYINNVTLEQVNRVARKIFNSWSLRFVVVGQPVDVVADY